MSECKAVTLWHPQRNRIYTMDALTFCGTLPTASVNCIVTSPPYWGLRDYGVAGQIGLEDSIDAYVAALVAIFHEARRALRDDGVLWLNLGDTYAGAGYSNHKNTGDALRENGGKQKHSYHPGLKPKDLCGIPWRVALALQADGWYLRSDVIWAKNNPMPESVTDRPTGAHEYVFLLTKSPRYWYDAYAIREPHARIWNPKTNGGSWAHIDRQPNGSKAGHHSGAYPEPNPAGRNARTVWTIATQPTSEAHFATFPQALVERCLLAGCPPTVCAACGAPHERVVEKKQFDRSNDRLYGCTLGHNPSGKVPLSNTRGMPDPDIKSLGFRPQCACAADTRPGLVFEPFMGSGTTALVARRLGRDFTGCDLSAEYTALAEKRLRESDPYQSSQLTPKIAQLSLFEALS